MAKQMTNEEFAVKIKPHRIGVIKSLNEARDDGDYGDENQRKVLLKSFVEHPNGWSMTPDGTIDVEPATPEQIEIVTKDRQELWDSYKTQAKADPAKSVDKDVFEEIYVANGKLLPIDLIAISGNRRFDVFLPAMVLRRKVKKEEGGPRSISEFIPCIIHRGLTHLQRLEIQVSENGLKAVGFLQMSLHNMLRAAMKMVDMGAIQNDLRKVFKDGTGQKLWGVIRMHKLFPNLKLLDRMFQPPGSEGYIHLPGVKFSDLPKMLARTDPAEMLNLNKARVATGNPELAVCDEAEVQRYFSDPASRPQPVAIMPKANIESLILSSNKFYGQAAKAIITNNGTVMQVGLDNAIACNALLGLIESGNGKQIETVLAKLATMPADKRVELLNQFVEVLTTG